MIYDDGMHMRVHEIIREILDSRPELTQKGLAERMGLNPAAVNRMLWGSRNIMAEEIPIIESYLGVKLSIPRQGLRGFEDGVRQEAPVPSYPAAVPPMIPVFRLDGKPDLRGAPADWTQRHPSQNGIAAAFAVYVMLRDMEPRYFKGELAYIHPGRPVEENRDCLVVLKTGEIFLRRLMQAGDDDIRVAQFRPPLKKNIARADIEALYAVAGRG